MRFSRLTLHAFGHFTEATLEFRPDRSFHVIYGPNSAGKSTTLRAVSDFLFGIRSKTTDDFLHPATSLRIGAEISGTTGTHALVRQRGAARGARKTLFGPNNAPADESTLQTLLGSMDRDTFESLYGLDHVRLREHGEALLRANGALDESIFDASSGASGLRSTLRSLEDESSQLYAPRAHSRKLAVSITAYESARKRMHEAELPGSEYHAREHERAELAAAAEQLSKERSTLQVEIAELERIARSLPIVAERAALLTRLASFEGLPELPDASLEEAIQAAGRVTSLAAEIASTEDELQAVTRELSALEDSGKLSQFRTSMERLSREHGPAAAAEKDEATLLQRIAELTQLRQSDLERAGHGLSLDDAARLSPAAPLESRIRELQEYSLVLAAQRETASTGANRERMAHEQALKALELLPVPSVDVDLLSDATSSARAEGNLEEALETARADHESQSNRVQHLLLQLPGWTGSAEALAQLAVPLPETVREFERSLRNDEDELEHALLAANERTEELERIEATRKQLEALGSVPSVQELEKARARREQAWLLIRRRHIDSSEDVTEETRAFDSTRTLVDAYTASVNEADAIADRLRVDAARVTEHEVVVRQMSQALARMDAARALIEGAKRKLADSQDRWRHAWAPSGITPATPSEMLAWLEIRKQVIDAASREREQSHRLDVLTTKAHACRLQLLGALGEGRAAEAPPLGLVLPRAERVLRETLEHGRRRELLAQSIAEASLRLQFAEQAEREADAKLASWHADWARVMAPLGLPADTSPTEAITYVEILLEIAARSNRLSELQHELERGRRLRTAFAEGVASLAREAAPELLHLAALPLYDELLIRFERSLQTEAVRVEKQRRSVSLSTKLGELRAQLTQAELHAEEVLRVAGAQDLQSLRLMAQRCAERRQLLYEIRAKEEALVHGGMGWSLEHLVREAEAHRGVPLSPRVRDLHERIEQLDLQLRARHEQLGAVQAGLDALARSQSAAAEAAQEMDSILCVIRRQAEDYIRLRLAQQLLTDFVERYRREHQDPLLSRASKLFATLTQGTFSGVRSAFNEKDQPILEGVRASGQGVLVSGMSDGTRDQLWLALRIAVLEQHMDKRDPLPFVADDLLVHFDDDRARAALTVLSDLAGRTQILFFTHHAHLVELAQSSVPEKLLQIVRLA